MPRIVDHEQRRTEIADALWQVVRRHGLAAVSVRSVAAEAGWSAGAIRHYFPTQQELAIFAMQSLLVRVRDRVLAARAEASSLEGVVGVLEEVLPLDRARRAEGEVWFAMLAAARTDPALSELALESHRGLRQLCSGVVRSIADQAGPALASRCPVDLEAEADRLHALVDGLAVHGTAYPQQMSAARIRRALRGQIDDLVSQIGGLDS